MILASFAKGRRTIEMDRETIRTRLNGVFRDIFDNERLTVADTTIASDVEGWDSLAHVNLIVAVEKAFRVSVANFGSRSHG